MKAKPIDYLTSIIRIGAIPLLVLGTAHASDLVTWDVVDKNADYPQLLPVSKTSSSVSASPVTMGPGLSLNPSSSGWRLKGHSGDAGYADFTVTTGTLNQVTMESLTFIVRAQAGSGTGAWVNPAITLEYSMDPAFTSPISAGTLSLGGDLAGGDSSDYGDYITATEDTFFSTPLVMNPSETYYFRLRASGAGSDAEKNQIMYRDTQDMKLTGTIVSTASGLVWAGADGANWNTTEQNFTDEDVPALFTTGADVVLKTAGAIEVDPGGITAGTVYVTAGSSSDTVSLQGGNLTSTNLIKAGNSNLKFTAPVSVSVDDTVIEGGRVTVDYISTPAPAIGATFSTTNLTLAGGGQLYIENPPVVFSTSNPVSLGAGGGTLRTNTGISLTLPGLSLSPTFPGTRFVKSGAGSLTFTGPVGTVGTAPIDLDFTSGDLVFQGAFDVAVTNATETNSVSGDMVLKGANLVLHNVYFDGDENDSLTVGHSASKITGYLDAGENYVQMPMILNTDLTVDAPVGDNDIVFDEDISGNGTLIKTGGGEVILTSKTSYSGLTSIIEGTFTVAGAFSNGGTLGTGTVSIASGATLSLDRSGTLSVPNQISGEGNLDVTGSYSIFGGVVSSITLGTANDYTGPTRLLDGSVVVPVLANAGQPSSLGMGNLLPENLLLSGGATLRYTGPQASTDRGFSLGSGGATISAEGSGPLSFTSTIPVLEEGTDTAPRILTLDGTAPRISSLAMPIDDGPNSLLGVTKDGANTWALTGTNTYSGATTVNDGILRIDGDSSLAYGDLIVADGGALGGNGTSGAYAFIESGGGLAVTISDWTGVAGSGYDELGLESLDAGSAPMTLAVDATDLVNFTDSSKTFTIINTVLGITNFDPANVTVTTSGFAGTGSWSLAVSGDSLVLSYEPSAYLPWISSYGLSGADADPGADYDKDGLTNQAEFAFGLDPTSGASVSPIQSPLDQGSETFAYTREKTALSEFDYTYGYSVTLQGDFITFTPYSEISDGGDPVEIVTVTLPAFLLEQSKLFVRVSAE